MATIADEERMPDSYLGDAVYASFDGFHIWLTAGDNKIALEDVVLRALDDYRKRIDTRFKIKRFGPREETE